LAIEPWPYFEMDRWVRHVTLAWSLSSAELAAAIPLVLDELPIAGTFDHGGVEDGTTGENLAGSLTSLMPPFVPPNAEWG
jgi:hypothetical protein